MNIIEALATLDPKNDEHWTGDGLPRVEFIAEATENAKVTRKEIGDALPGLTRATFYEEFEPADAGATEEGDEEPATDDVADDVSSVEKEAAGALDSEKSTEAAPEADLDTEEEAELEEVEAEESVLAMDPRRVLNDPELTEKALVEIEARMARKADLVRRLEKEIAADHRWNEIIKRAMRSHRNKGYKQDNRTAIQRYQEGQAKVREERMRRAKAFAMAGTNRTDVAEATRDRSKLDEAMSGRKPARGSQRPARG